jgi:hypothetical protein
MTVIKKFDTGTSQWETIVVGKQGPSGQWDTAQDVDTKTADYTLVTADAGRLIIVDSATDEDVTVDGSLDLAVGQRIDLLQVGCWRGDGCAFWCDGEWDTGVETSGAVFGGDSVVCGERLVCAGRGCEGLMPSTVGIVASAASNFPSVTLVGASTDVVANIGGQDYRIVTWLSSGSITGGRAVEC